MSIGAGVGFGIVICLLSLWTSTIEFLQPIVNVLVAPIALVGSRLKLSDSASYGMVVVYFSIIGFIAAWLLTALLRFRWILLILFIAFLVTIHWESYQQMSRELTGLAELFQSMATGKS